MLAEISLFLKHWGQAFTFLITFFIPEPKKARPVRASSIPSVFKIKKTESVTLIKESKRASPTPIEQRSMPVILFLFIFLKKKPHKNILMRFHLYIINIFLKTASWNHGNIHCSDDCSCYNSCNIWPHGMKYYKGIWIYFIGTFMSYLCCCWNT